VAYDEPPPEEWRKENNPRLWARNGCERYALTPVNMAGGGIGWLYRKIYKKRLSDPEITVVKGSGWENRHLPREAIEYGLSQYDDAERAAREHGDFVHLGGMVYDGGFDRCLLELEPSAEDVRKWDRMVGIDPGLRNAAFTWWGFDSENTAYGFDEALLQQQTPADYALTIFLTNARWGIGSQDERVMGLMLLDGLLAADRITAEEHAEKTTFLRGARTCPDPPVYVIDPSAKNRSLTDGRSVKTELQNFGVFAIDGNNSVEAGCQQIRLRIQHRKFWVARSLAGLRGEAEEYRQEDRDDGEFKVVKENDHRLDTARYVVMRRPWFPSHEETAPQRRGYEHGYEPPYRAEFDDMNSPPLGALS
jgi:hypothetical protein